jgi:hypothetical protein
MSELEYLERLNGVKSWATVSVITLDKLPWYIRLFGKFCSNTKKEGNIEVTVNGYKYKGKVHIYEEIKIEKVPYKEVKS